MRPLSFEEIDTVWQQKFELNPADAQLVVDTLGAQQPYVLSYLLSAESDVLQPSERELLFYMGVLIWLIIDSLKITIPEITLENLMEHEEKNFLMLEYLAGEPDGEFIPTVEKIMDNYNQNVFLRYIIDRIIEEPDKNSGVIDNHIGVMVIYLKTVIDCIDSVT